MVWDELPERWELASLGDIAQDIQTGFACSARDEEGLPHLRPNNVGTDGKLNLNLVKRVPFEAGDLSRYDLKPGDVLFNNTNSQELVGKTAIFDLEGTYSFSNHLTRIKVRVDLLIPEWLSLWFQHLWHTRYFERICNRWIGQAGINAEKLSGVEVPLPPLPEQRRIVARIEELTERIDAARRLRAEAAEEAVAILPSALAEVFREAEERGWQITELGQVIREMRNGIYKPKQFYGGGYPSLRMYNIQDRQIVMENVKYLKVTEDELETYGLKPGDILVNRVNSKELVGKAALVPDGLGPCTFESKNIRVRVDETQVTPAYVVYFLDSVVCKQQIAQRLKPAIGQATINQGDIQSLEMPLPPLNEQRRIVEHLDAVQAKVEAIRRYQAETREEIEAMTGAVLERALRGEL